MTITYPLSLPTSRTASGAKMEVRPLTGVSRSVFTPGMQSYDWQAEAWFMEWSMPPMERAYAEPWVAFLLSLYGMTGSFLAGQPGYTTPQGTWSGQSPQVNNEVGSPTLSQTGRSLYIKNLSAGSTIKAGDYFQLGSGSTSRLHKVVKDVTADGSGLAQLDITPKLRSAPAHSAALTLASPKGLFMLPSNKGDWDIGEAMIYGITFDAMEDLRGL